MPMPAIMPRTTILQDLFKQSDCLFRFIGKYSGYRGGKNCLSDLQDSLKAMNRNWIDIWMTHMIEKMEDYELCIELGGFCDIAYSAKT